MNEFGRIKEQYSNEVERTRRRTGRAASHRHAERRTTRRALATGLHRLADRLDGGL